MNRLTDVQDTGSSPRVRGKPTPAGALDTVKGLIPACAGKTVTFKALVIAPPAHPRVCGENLRFLKPLPPNLGSSPRVRGKPDANDRKR